MISKKSVAAFPLAILLAMGLASCAPEPGMNALGAGCAAARRRSQPLLSMINLPNREGAA